jgi:hypothetical protein
MKSFVHKKLLYMSPPVEAEPQSNTLVGAKTNGKIDTDSSFKITSGAGVSRKISGGAVLMGASNLSPLKRRNKEKMDSLVRTIF